jgi:hypothetical protein
MVIIQGNGTIRTIFIIKHLGNNDERLEVLLGYDFCNGIIDEEQNVMFVMEFKLFSRFM